MKIFSFKHILLSIFALVYLHLLTSTYFYPIYLKLNPLTCLNYPPMCLTSLMCPTFTNVYLCSTLQMCICALMCSTSQMCPTCTNVYLCPNVPHFSLYPNLDFFVHYRLENTLKFTAKVQSQTERVLMFLVCQPNWNEFKTDNSSIYRFLELLFSKKASDCLKGICGIILVSEFIFIWL